jgi:hypothetical protein
VDTVVGGACIFGVKDGETEKMTNEQVNEQAAIAWYILAQCAMEKKLLTYGELAYLMNSQYKSRLCMNYRNCKYALGLIQAYCRKHSLPALQSLVVNGRSRKPGKGYTGSTPEEVGLEQHKVFSHKWELANSFENWKEPRA